MSDSFILYTEYSAHMELLSMEQRGVLFTAIMCYEMETPLPEMDLGVKMAFSFIKANLDRNRAKYEDIKEKRRAAGEASALTRRNKKEQTPTKRTSVKRKEQASTNATDNVNVNVNVNENDIEIYSISERVQKEINAFIEHRKKLKKPMTEKAVSLMIGKLYKMGETDDDRIALLDEAIEHGWLSIYPFKESPPREKPKKNAFTRFPQREYNEDDLESFLLEGVRR